MRGKSLETRAADLRTCEFLRRHNCHSPCELCGGGVRTPGETRCGVCRRLRLDPVVSIPKIPTALRVRLCIVCERPFEPHPRRGAPREYCSQACGGAGVSLMRWSWEEWDGCRMIADLDYFGPYPFAESHWPQIERLAIGTDSIVRRSTGTWTMRTTSSTENRHDSRKAMDSGVGDGSVIRRTAIPAKGVAFAATDNPTSPARNARRFISPNLRR